MKVQIYGHDYYLNDQKIRENFSLKELANNDGDQMKPQFIIDSNVDLFLDMLQEFRKWFNKPMRITSCYRQEEFNNKLQNSNKKSAHIHACAIDWYIKGHTECQRTNVRNKWADICSAHKVIGSINFYTNGYHLEAFSDKWYGQKTFQVRDYRKTKQDW